MLDETQGTKFRRGGRIAAGKVLTAGSPFCIKDFRISGYSYILTVTGAPGFPKFGEIQMTFCFK